MARPDYACGLDIAHNLQCLAIEDKNVIAAADVEELLVGIRRQSQIERKRFAGSDQLLQEFAVFGKHLNAPVFSISHVDGAVIGQADGVYDAELLRSRMREAGWRNDHAVVIVHWLVAECAPHPRELATIGIEDSNAVIAVTIGHEQFV